MQLTAEHILFAFRILGRASTLLATVILSRYISPNEFGAWVLLWTAYRMFYPFSSLGLETSYFALKNDKDDIKSQYIHTFFKSYIVFSLVIILGLLLTDNYRYLVIFLALLAIGYFRILSAFFRVSRPRYSAILEDVYPTLALFISILVFLFFKNNEMSFFYSFLAVILIIASVLSHPVSISLDSLWKSKVVIFNQSFKYVLVSGLIVSLGMLNRFFIEEYCGKEVLGTFQVYVVMSSFIPLVSQAVNIIVTRSVGMSENSEEWIKESMRKMTKLSLLLGLPLTSLLLAKQEYIFPMIFESYLIDTEVVSFLLIGQSLLLPFGYTTLLATLNGALNRVLVVLFLLNIFLLCVMVFVATDYGLLEFAMLQVLMLLALNIFTLILCYRMSYITVKMIGQAAVFMISILSLLYVVFSFISLALGLSLVVLISLVTFYYTLREVNT